MPSRNVVKQFAPYNYYHVYNRGVAKDVIFKDSADKKHFIKILERHLDPNNSVTKLDGLPYRKFNDDLELLCFCLMNNHFHLMFYIKGKDKAISSFMQSALTAYTMYFNKRHKRVGTLFQGVFKASRITSDSYLQHITRYIHLNPRTYKTYAYSSLQYYLGQPTPVWLNTQRILDIFDGDSYEQFVDDYEDHKNILEGLRYELASY